MGSYVSSDPFAGRAIRCLPPWLSERQCECMAACGTRAAFATMESALRARLGCAPGLAGHHRRAQPLRPTLAARGAAPAGRRACAIVNQAASNGCDIAVNSRGLVVSVPLPAARPPLLACLHTGNVPSSHWRRVQPRLAASALQKLGSGRRRRLPPPAFSACALAGAPCRCAPTRGRRLRSSWPPTVARLLCASTAPGLSWACRRCARLQLGQGSCSRRSSGKHPERGACHAVLFGCAPSSAASPLRAPPLPPATCSWLSSVRPTACSRTASRRTSRTRHARMGGIGSLPCTHARGVAAAAAPGWPAWPAAVRRSECGHSASQSPRPAAAAAGGCAGHDAGAVLPGHPGHRGAGQGAGSGRHPPRVRASQQPAPAAPLQAGARRRRCRRRKALVSGVQAAAAAARPLLHPPCTHSITQTLQLAAATASCRRTPPLRARAARRASLSWAPSPRRLRPWETRRRRAAWPWSAACPWCPAPTMHWWMLSRWVGGECGHACWMWCPGGHAWCRSHGCLSAAACCRWCCTPCPLLGLNAGQGACSRGGLGCPRCRPCAPQLARRVTLSPSTHTHTHERRPRRLLQRRGTQ